MGYKAERNDPNYTDAGDTANTEIAIYDYGDKSMVFETLYRTVRHLTDNGVDLDKEPLSMGPILHFDPVEEVFANHAAANRMVTRDYRKPFLCPSADKV